MIGALRRRRQQQKDQIDRILVHGFEIDGMFETREQRVEVTKSGELGVGNGDAVTDTGGAQPFSFEQCVEDFPLVFAADSAA